MPTTKTSWVIVTLLLSTTVLALTWALERRQRLAAEAEVRDLRRALGPAGERARMPAVGESPGDATRVRSRPAAAGEGRGGGMPAPPAPSPSPAAAGEGRGEGMSASPSSPAPAPPASGDPLIDIDLTRVAEEFDRLLPLLRARVGVPVAARGVRDRELIAATLGKLLAADPATVRARLLDALRTEQHYGLFTYLFELAEPGAPAAAAQAVRELAEAPDPGLRANALTVLRVLPESEAEGLWQRMLADPDPYLRMTAILTPPGADPRFDRAARDAALRESDPTARGEHLFAAFAARPTQENLDAFVTAVERDADPAFRREALRWLGPQLTPRDAEAVRVLRALAGRSDEDPLVRRRAAEILLSGGDKITPGLVPAAERPAWERLLQEIPQ